MGVKQCLIFLPVVIGTADPYSETCVEGAEVATTGGGCCWCATGAAVVVAAIIWAYACNSKTLDLALILLRRVEI